MVAEVGYSKYIYVCQIGESIKIFERGVEKSIDV